MPFLSLLLLQLDHRWFCPFAILVCGDGALSISDQTAETLSLKRHLGFGAHTLGAFRRKT